MLNTHYLWQPLGRHENQQGPCGAERAYMTGPLHAESGGCLAHRPIIEVPLLTMARRKLRKSRDLCPCGSQGCEPQLAVGVIGSPRRHDDCGQQVR